MDALRKSLKIYFNHLEKHRRTVGDILTQICKPVETFNNFSEQLSSVKSAEIEDMPIGKIPNIKENLIFKIQSCIEEEIATIQKLMEGFEAANSELEKKLQNVQRCLENLGDLTELDDRQVICTGSAVCPSILQMIEWSQDSWRLYYASYLKLCNYVKAIESEDHKKIEIMNKKYLECEEQYKLHERMLDTQEYQQVPVYLWKEADIMYTKYCK